jgi:choline dehydrogenase
MVYTRGHRWDYDHWAELGNRGWSYAEMLPLFKRSQHQERGPSEHHGVGGPLNVADPRQRSEISEVLSALRARRAIRSATILTAPRRKGSVFYQLTQKEGRRWSSARAYLHPIRQRPNLTIITHALASRVLFEGKRAVGVAYRTREGQMVEIQARGEVLLSGGAINSPQLLLLSGIGPRAELERHGIPQIHELPGVGQNLQDHLDVIVAHRECRRASYGFALSFLPRLLKSIVDYRRHGRGFLTSNLAEAGGFVKSDPALPLPNLQYHLTSTILDDSRAAPLARLWLFAACLRPAAQESRLSCAEEQ